MKRFLALAALGLACGTAFSASPALAQFSLNISVNFMPPALPVYDQPPIPGPDYIWAPGYWAWDDYVQDYYWVPGTWVMAPRPGLLWTPPWWGWQDGVYLFHSGYWGPHVGFYGGVAYGFGYTGSGYQGAYWNGGHVFYNRSVTNIANVNVTNVYNKTVIVNRTTNVSYNGGPGGVQTKPSPAEQSAMRDLHVAPTAVQQQHFQAARSNKQLFASANHGSPPIAAAARPGQFGGPGIVRTRQAPAYHPPQSPPHAGAAQPGGPGELAHPPATQNQSFGSPQPTPHPVPEGAPPPSHNLRNNPSPNAYGRPHGGNGNQPEHVPGADLGQGHGNPAEYQQRTSAPYPDRPNAVPHTTEPQHAPQFPHEPSPPPRPAQPPDVMAPPPHPANHPHPQGGHPNPPPQHHEEHHEH